VTISKEVKVGLLALVSGVILYFGFNFLKGSDLFSTSTKYFIIYDNIDGLTASNSVTLNGLSVGKVEKIEILQNRDNKILVQIALNSNIIVTDSAKAVLADNGLLGGKVITLEVGKGSRVLDDDDTLQAAIKGGLSAMLEKKASPILNNLEALSASLTVTMAQFDSTGIILNSTLKSYQKTSQALNGMISDKQGLKGTMANFNQLSASLVTTERQLKPLLGKFNSIADSLSQSKLKAAVGNANQAIAQLNTVLTDLNSGKGTLGKIAKNDSLYSNLNNTAADLDRLFIDLKENPKRYVHFSLFGRKDKSKQPDSTRIKKTKVVTTYK
jgi:phospholipid/cholesterol/gamma-HCH transport system substrate-binding protein